MNLTEKQLKTEYIYKGKIINMRRDEALLPNGRTALREVVEHPGGVCIAALTDDDELLFVRQFRYPYFEVIAELPAGKLEKGEDPLQCAIRELSEETGFTAEEYIYLGEFYPSPGYCHEKLYAYLALGLKKGNAHLDDGEFLDVLKFPLDKLVEMVMNNELCDAKTIIAILKAKTYLAGLK